MQSITIPLRNNPLPQVTYKLPVNTLHLIFLNEHHNGPSKAGLIVSKGENMVVSFVIACKYFMSFRQPSCQSHSRLPPLDSPI